MYAHRLYITFFPPVVNFCFSSVQEQILRWYLNSRWATCFSCASSPTPRVMFHIFTKRSELRHGAALQKPNSAPTLNLFLLVHTVNRTLPVTLPLSFPDALPYSQTAFARRTSGALPCKFESSKMRDRHNNNNNNNIIQFLNFNLSFMDMLV